MLKPLKICPPKSDILGYGYFDIYEEDLVQDFYAVYIDIKNLQIFIQGEQLKTVSTQQFWDCVEIAKATLSDLGGVSYKVLAKNSNRKRTAKSMSTIIKRLNEDINRELQLEAKAIIKDGFLLRFNVDMHLKNSYIKIVK